MHFSTVDLGDKRRNKRLPQLVDELVRHPRGTLPEKLPRAADQEAFYRLCDAPEVTHAAVLKPHRELVLEKLQTTRKFLLVIHDATELDFTSRTSLTKLGQIGNGNKRGYIAHQSLVVDPEMGTVVGLANQILHTRADVPKDENIDESRERESRESRLWLQGTQDLPARRQIIDVSDRGSDTFEYLEHEVHSGRTFVIRAKNDRSILPGHTQPQASGKNRDGVKPIMLFDYARQQKSLGQDTVTVRITVEQRAKAKEDFQIELPTQREARLQISATKIRVKPPRVHRGNHGRELLPMWIVRVWEPNPPEGCEPLEWLLLTNHSSGTAREARFVKRSYEARWIIEEYHKGQKTGCGIETLQFRDEDRLQPAIAILSIVALTLLQLRDAARDPTKGQRRADELIHPEAIQVLSLWEHGDARPDWNLHDYSIALAKLGGYRPRKNCPPGWLVLWRGQMKLEYMLDGVRLVQKTRGKPKKCAMS